MRCKNSFFSSLFIGIIYVYIGFVCIIFYIIRSNFIFVFVVTVIAVSKWTSDGSAVGVAFKTEMIGAFYVPIFLFLTQAKIINNVMRLFPINT